MADSTPVSVPKLLDQSKLALRHALFQGVDFSTVPVFAADIVSLITELYSHYRIDVEKQPRAPGFDALLEQAERKLDEALKALTVLRSVTHF